ncbi:hypothetical protein PHLGIDRAFT_130607 [Phlebiopsis gigantea 11061_1 CR5-6]|uniref:F-box domain-containing protein n=1 Tax=Phlebiopsis gigantea (strain 11061_1 CR5-6) TaxID=745531 RepID=A0A0C3PC69_PHLG1|nr:hypothetical protein PHLGIDRAFT_130607 [Phlebiopsis gigantea 11061_1 CR5-6]
MTLSPVLLPELIDNITRFLQHDKSSLTRCSQVSHTWCQSSRRRLFHSVQLREPPLTYPTEPLDALFIFLRDCSYLRELVHELRFVSADGVFEAGISIGRIRSFIEILPSLRSLIIGSLHFYELDDADSIVGTTRRADLQSLSLSASFSLGIHPTFLSRTLALFDGIGALRFQGFTLYRSHLGGRPIPLPVASDLELARVTTRPAVTAVTIGRFHATAKVLDLLPLLVDVDSLERLCITSLPESTLPPVDTLIHRATHLREVSLLFHRFSSSNLAYALAQTAQTRLPALAACAALEAISLGVEIHLDHELDSVNGVYWHRALALLADAPACVRRVHIAVRTWAVADTSCFAPLAALDWALLDALLARYAQLEEFRVLVSSRSVAPWIVGVDAMCAELAGKFSGRNMELVEIVFGETDAWDI